MTIHGNLSYFEHETSEIIKYCNSTGWISIYKESMSINEWITTKYYTFSSITVSKR